MSEENSTKNRINILIQLAQKRLKVGNEKKKHGKELNIPLKQGSVNFFDQRHLFAHFLHSGNPTSFDM